MQKKYKLNVKKLPKKILTAAAKYDSTIKIKLLKFHALMLGFLVKDGKINKARSLLDKSFFLVRKRLNLSRLEILYRLMLRLFLIAEIRKIKVYGKTHLVPFPLSESRKIYVAVKTLIDAAKSNIKKTGSLEQSLAYEISDICMGSTCDSLLAIKTIMHLSIRNRSNSTFRWY